MKRLTIRLVVLTIIFCLSLTSSGLAKPVSREKVLKAANTFLQAEKIREGKKPAKAVAVAKKVEKLISPNEFNTGEIKEICDNDGKIIAYVIELKPRGFIVTSADSNLSPILAYSFNGEFPFEDSENNILLHMIKQDVKTKHNVSGSNATRIESSVKENVAKWEIYITADNNTIQALADSQQSWPEQTGWCPYCKRRQDYHVYPNNICEQCGQYIWEKGWITTAWNQNMPWNKFCPKDPAYSLVDPTNRSVVGCTATAAAQIINYWKYPSSVWFSEKDAYWYFRPWSLIPVSIDANHIIYDFPSFGELNVKLASINYEVNDPNRDAYLSFAAGIKHKMQYSKDGSGTPLSSFAYKDGFCYGSAIYRGSVFDLWSTYEDRVVENIKKEWPVQLGLNSSTNLFLSGHSVIVDGYRTSSNEKFLHNLGGGAGDDFWFSPPLIDTYNMVTQIVYDICPYQGWYQYGADQFNTFRTLYNAPTITPLRDKWPVSCPGDYYFNGLVVGTGNNIYASCSSCEIPSSRHPSIYVIDQYGTKKKELLLENETRELTYPVQNKNGDIFVGTGSGKIYKIDTKTDSNTVIFTEPASGQIQSKLKIDDESHIYAYTLQKLYCLNGSTQLWSLPLSANQYFLGAPGPSIDTVRQRVYMTYYDSSTSQSYLACINRQTGLLVEARPDCGGSPSIGADGTVYIGGLSTFYALDPAHITGLPKWTKPMGSSTVAFNTPMIGRDGTIYLSYKIQLSGSWYLKCQALNPIDGSTKWEKSFSASMADDMCQSYVAGNDVVVLTVGWDNGDNPDTYNLYAYRDAGDHYEDLWSKSFGESGGDMVFGPGATLYVVPTSGFGHTIYAVSEGPIGDPQGGGMGFLNNSAPNTPSNPSPADGTSNLGPSVTLSWGCSHPQGHSLKYSIFASKSGYNMVPFATDIDVNSYQIEGLEPNNYYNWKVVATDGQAVTDGPTWTFSTKPINCELNVESPVNFKDYAILAKHWLDTCSSAGGCEGADINWDKAVNIDDLALFVSHWLESVVLIRDDFNGLYGDPLNSTLWTPYLDICGGWGGPGGEVYQDGNGWAKVDVAPYWTGSGFYTAQTCLNTGQYHIEGRLKFTRGTNNADNVFMIIRNPDNSYRVDCPYESYDGPQIRFNIHPTHYSGQGGFTSVYIFPKNNSGWQPQISTSNEIIWSGTNIVVMSIDYNADTGQIDFKLYNADKTSVLTECQTTINAQTLADIGPTFRLEMGMDGYNSYDHYWDYIEISQN
ncbi:MAG: C10 family peptidase [Sedimentisphaerales bacterium]